MSKNGSRQIYLRGDIVNADFDPSVGSEQGGYRPAVIVQNDTGNLHSSTVVVCPISSVLKKVEMGTHVVLDGINGLDKTSIVLLEQIRTIDKSRIGRVIGHMPDEVMSKINSSLLVCFGIKTPALPEEKGDVGAMEKVMDIEIQGAELDEDTDQGVEAQEKQNDEKRTYTVFEIQDILGISQPTAYALIQRNVFHSIRVGRHIRISKKSFDEWLDNGGC